MRTKLFLFLALMAWTTSLSAQITREQADDIVQEHINNEITSPYLLYVNVKAPSETGIALTTANAENMKVKYACWAYYLNEHPGVSEPTQHRYLLVKEDNGNLLEIITYNDLGPNDLTEWMLVKSNGVIEIEKNSIHIYPNPTTGELTIENGKWRMEKIEFFDIYGRKIQSFNHSTLQSLNISSFPAGIYLIKIETETEIIKKKIIKK